MTHKQIISFILDNKEIIYLITVLLTIIVLLIANVKYAAALQSCNAAKVEQYKNNDSWFNFDGIESIKTQKRPPVSAWKKALGDEWHYWDCAWELWIRTNE